LRSNQTPKTKSHTHLKNGKKKKQTTMKKTSRTRSESTTCNQNMHQTNTKEEILGLISMNFDEVMTE